MRMKGRMDIQHCLWSGFWRDGKKKWGHCNWTNMSRGLSCMTWQMPSHTIHCLGARSQRENHRKAFLRWVDGIRFMFWKPLWLLCRWWTVETKAEAGKSRSQLMPKNMVARTREEAVEMERRSGHLWTCWWVECWHEESPSGFFDWSTWWELDTCTEMGRLGEEQTCQGVWGPVLSWRHQAERWRRQLKT